MKTFGIIACVFFLTALVEAAPSAALHRAVRFVESGDRASAYNRRLNAAGAYQVRPCAIADCNKFFGGSWTLRDRYDTAKAAKMFDQYTQGWVKRLKLKGSSEVYARIWAGGPYGWKKRRTLGYWRRVRRRLPKVRVSRPVKAPVPVRVPKPVKAPVPVRVPDVPVAVSSGGLVPDRVVTGDTEGTASISIKTASISIDTVSMDLQSETPWARRMMVLLVFTTLWCGILSIGLYRVQRSVRPRKQRWGL